MDRPAPRASPHVDNVDQSQGPLRLPAAPRAWRSGAGQRSAGQRVKAGAVSAIAPATSTAGIQGRIRLRSATKVATNNATGPAGTGSSTPARTRTMNKFLGPVAGRSAVAAVAAVTVVAVEAEVAGESPAGTGTSQQHALLATMTPAPRQRRP